MDNNKVSPLFNYIGGKTWLKSYLIKEVESLSNTKIDSYCEPFAGGLGAFLGVAELLLEKNIKNITLNDINKKLINLYCAVKDKPQELIATYIKIETDYKKLIPSDALLLHKTKDKIILKEKLKPAELFFQNKRKLFNKEEEQLSSASLLLFLQGHCFNGVYRENTKGEYNTPFNWESKTYTEENISKKIMNLNNLFRKFNIAFTSVSFEDIKYSHNCLYYLDPPYLNEDELVENKYNKSGFSLEKQKELINKIKNVPFIYSNHDSNILIDEFNTIGKNVKIQKIARKNIISASTESRKKDKIEILVSSILS